MRISALIVASIAVLMMFGCGKTKETYEKSFKESFKKSFVKSCTESAMKGGVKEDMAKTKCDCMATQLVTTLSSVELTKLAKADSPESKKAFETALNACK